MRTSTRMIAGAATLALALGGTAFVATGAEGPGGPGPGPEVTTPARTVTATSIDETTTEHIVFVHEEERLARDLYTALDDHHGGLLPFSAIKISEQRHLDAAARLLEAYGIADPSAGLAAGEFGIPELQRLYDDWLERGLTSQEEAFAVGIELETADVADLEARIAEVEDARVERVLGNLLDGSRRHLAAFERAAEGWVPGDCDGTGTRQQAPGQGKQQGQQQGPGKGLQQGPRTGQGKGLQQGQGPGDGSGDCPYAEPTD